MILPTSAAKDFRSLSKKGNFFYEGEGEPVEEGNKLLLSFDNAHSFLEAGFNFKVKIRTVDLNKETQVGQILNKQKIPIDSKLTNIDLD